jgi:hypothetical protein
MLNTIAEIYKIDGSNITLKFLRFNMDNRRKSSYQFSDITNGVSQIFGAAKKTYSFVTRNPLTAIAGLLYFQATFAGARNTNLTVTCPGSYGVALAVNNNWNQTDCEAGITSSANFPISSNPLENLFNDMQLVSSCDNNTQFILDSVPEMSVLNVNNNLGVAGYNMSYLACRYHISIVNPPLNSTGCVLTGNYPGQCWYPGDDGYFGLYTTLANSTSCQVRDSQFVCQRDLTPSPLNGTWQATNSLYPHIVYNDVANTIAYGVNPKVNGSGTTCAMQLFGQAAVMQNIFNASGEYDFTINLDPSKSILVDQSAECQTFFNNSKSAFIDAASGRGFFLTGNNTANMSRVAAGFANDESVMLYNVRGGTRYYQDSANNTYGFGSTFNVSEAVVIAKQANASCNLNLTRIAPPPSRFGFFKLKATDNCQTELHEMNVAYSLNVSDAILNCVADTLADITSSRTMPWPTWNCPPSAGQSYPSSSTGPSGSSTGSDQPNDNGFSRLDLILAISAAAVAGVIAALALTACIIKRRTPAPIPTTHQPLLLEEEKENTLRGPSAA